MIQVSCLERLSGVCFVTLNRAAIAKGKAGLSRALSTMAENPDPKEAKAIFDFNADDIDGNNVELSKYNGFVTFIVNLASK